MFTGIITHLGKVQSIKKSHYVFSADASFLQRLQKGVSVAINGICLTVETDPATRSFSVEVMPETVKKTIINELRIGALVNLELPLSPRDLFSGHIVQGHVDGIGIITKIQLQDNSHVLTVKIDPELSRYTIDKGSVAVNGISLTVIKSGHNFFTIGIIPYTWKHTMLHRIKTDDKVNIEVDIIAKYLEKLLRRYQ